MLKKLKLSFRDFRLSPKADSGTIDIVSFHKENKTLSKKLRSKHEFKLDKQARCL